MLKICTQILVYKISYALRNNMTAIYRKWQVAKKMYCTWTFYFGLYSSFINTRGNTINSCKCNTRFDWWVEHHNSPINFQTDKRPVKVARDELHFLKFTRASVGGCVTGWFHHNSNVTDPSLEFHLIQISSSFFVVHMGLLNQALSQPWSKNLQHIHIRYYIIDQNLRMNL